MLLQSLVQKQSAVTSYVYEKLLSNHKLHYDFSKNALLLEIMEN